MRCVIFAFRPWVSPWEQEEVLSEINRWEAVLRASKFGTRAGPPKSQPEYCAYVKEDAPVLALIQELTRLPQIESAFIPAPRRTA